MLYSYVPELTASLRCSRGKLQTRVIVVFDGGRLRIPDEWMQRYDNLLFVDTMTVIDSVMRIKMLIL